MRKILWLVLSSVMVAGCHPRVSYELRSLSPSARQQLFTYEEGPRRALVCTTVDLTPTSPPPYHDLAGDSAEVGYVSSDNHGGVRRRCRRDSNFEIHSGLAFDLAPVFSSPPAGTLHRVSLSGEEHGSPDNSACDLTRDSLLKLVVTEYRPASREFDTATPHLAAEVGEVAIGEATYSFREYAYVVGEGDTLARVGSDPNFVYTWSADSLRSLRARLERGSAGSGDYHLTLIGADNPDMTSDRHCLARLSNLRLNLFFRSE